MPGLRAGHRRFGRPHSAAYTRGSRWLLKRTHTGGGRQIWSTR